MCPAKLHQPRSHIRMPLHAPSYSDGWLGKWLLQQAVDPGVILASTARERCQGLVRASRGRSCGHFAIMERYPFLTNAILGQDAMVFPTFSHLCLNSGLLAVVGGMDRCGDCFLFVLVLGVSAIPAILSSSSNVPVCSVGLERHDRRLAAGDHLSFSGSAGDLLQGVLKL